jgi:hypothetical protein
MKYRVTVMVTTDVEAEDFNDAITNAIDKVEVLIARGDGGVNPTENPAWVTGIGRDINSGHLIFEMSGQIHRGLLYSLLL